MGRFVRFLRSHAVSAPLVAALVMVYVFVPVPGFMAERGRWLLRAAAHPLFHANVLHLAVNCGSCLTLFSSRGWRRDLATLGLSYGICILTYVCALRPVIGISNVLCASVGLLAPVSLRHPWWRSPATLAFFGGMVVTAILPGVSALTHIVSFLLAFGLHCAYSRLTDIYHDYERASR